MNYRTSDIDEYRAACAQYIESGHNPYMLKFNVPLPKPVADEGVCYARCHRCGGTGKYCRFILNDRPQSNTGFTCLSCGGLGWKSRKKPANKKSTA